MTDVPPPFLNALRDWLLGAFNPDELDDLLYFAQAEELQEVRKEFAPADGLPIRVRKTLEYCQRHDLFDEFLQEIEQRRPGEFQAKRGSDSREVLEPETVLIPHGPFWMGSDAIQGASVPDHEKPKHEVKLADYWIGVYPITNAQYAEFVRHTSHRVALEAGWEGLVPPRKKHDHPMVGVTWYDALAYCDWLKKQTGRPYTLPSEAQWEKAARGTDGRIYPWGDTWEPDRCNHRFSEIEEVNAYQPQSVYGCYDMVGNAREWTSSLWGRKLIAPEYGYPWKDHEAVRDNLSASRSMYRVYRGGAAADESQLRCSARNGCDPKITGYPMRRMGFRVAWNP